MRPEPLRLLPLLALVFLAPFASPQGTPIGFEEEFALAVDRERALEQLIPGTADYYYYHCLHAQHTGSLESSSQEVTVSPRQLPTSLENVARDDHRRGLEARG